jgi:hypothetical protein
MLKTSILKYILSCVVFILSVHHTSAQFTDSAFYNSGALRSVTICTDSTNELAVFFDTSGKNILEENFKYEYFDSTMLLQRYVIVKSKAIFREYYVDRIDTIYIKAQFDEGFENNALKYLKFVRRKLRYPKEAKRAKIQGRAQIRMLIDNDGTIKHIEPLTNLGFGLEDAIIEVINKDLLFGKVHLDGKAVKCLVCMPIRFVLDPRDLVKSDGKQ